MADKEKAQTHPPQPPPVDLQQVERDLKRVAHMFSPYRDDALMRELCRLAVKSIQERWIDV